MVNTLVAALAEPHSETCANAIPLSCPATPTSSPYVVEHLSDTELLAGTRGLVARSNHQLARLLAHLAEVETRGIHRVRACSSLYTYCVYELRLSEDTAFRYARAAKLARKFPVLFDQLAAGELHLTGLLLLGPHLTDDNYREVLQLAKHRTKREIIKLVRRLDPLPDVPPRIEPLGPARTGQPLMNPTWSAFIESFNPVRELEPSERPSQWLQLGSDAESESPIAECSQAPSSGADVKPGLSSDPQRGETAQWLNPQRYSVQFTASQEYVDLLERAKSLLSHAVPSRSLEEIQLRAMRGLVAELEKQRFGIGRKPRSPMRSRDAEGTEAPVRSDTIGTSTSGSSACAGAESPSGRCVPADVRRKVFERDTLRCAYVTADGQRCRETDFLELHHHDPYARGGAAVVQNLALYCRSHNALLAERDFGRASMARRSGRD